MKEFTLLSLYRLLRENIKILFILTLLGAALSVAAGFLLGNTYEKRVTFEQANLNIDHVNRVRFDLIGTDITGDEVVQLVGENIALETSNFRKFTILSQPVDNRIDLIQTLNSPEKVQKVSEVTSRLLAEKNHWQIVSSSEVIEKAPPVRRLAVLGTFISFFFACGFVVARKDFNYRFTQETTMKITTAKMEVKKVTPVYFILKRAMDIVVGSLGLIPFAVSYCILYIPYSFGENKGPMLFKQKRYGLNGEYFHIYKFRSMRVGAEEILKADPALWQKYVDNGYKLPQEEDPRITKLGRFIRKTSLDEFPQFINVVKGEMSLIGPRPIISEELDEYGERKEYFLAMKPGITGVWGISGRSNLDYPERADVELSYLNKRSIGFDFYVLWKTFTQVIRREGAY